MTKKITASSKILTVIAFILLWITRGMYYYLEISTSYNIVFYVMLGVLCVTVFSLTLYGVKYTPVFIVGLAGVVTLCTAYLFIYGTERLVFFAPVVCCAPLLFLINNYKTKEGEAKKSFLEQIGNELFGILPFIILALIIYNVIKESFYHEKGQLYYIFISIAVASLYIFSVKMPKKSDTAGKIKDGESKASFMTAGILIIESYIYCTVYHLLIFQSIIVMIWFVVYLFLYEYKNSVCVNTIESVKNKFKKFIDI